MEINKEPEKIAEKANEYIKELYKRSREDHGTSQKRFDYLIVTVCGAGIYIVLELMKFLYEQKLTITTSLKLSGLFLATSLIFNFTSQFFTFNVFNSVLKMEQIEALDLPIDIKTVAVKIKKYDLLARLFILLSILLMILGIIGIIAFLFITF
ncbi:hypothetical protein [Flavobacterium limnophilum]|uniref:hypothetical protein n=1 Tax=Flavobacterium limnophilum TaxID=3003262 RepID=UPI0022AC84ED|nr:hypothetical protein [Flavobacterium limnophilum]